MRFINWVAALAVLLPSTAVVALEGHGPPAPPGKGIVQAKQLTPEQAEVAALSKQYQEAMMAYQKPLMDAKTREEREKVKLDPEKHPAREFYPKFRDLAVKLGRNEAALTAWIMARTTATAIRDTSGADAALEAILKDFINAEGFAAYVPRLVPMSPGDTPEQLATRSEAMLARVERESTNPEVLAAVLARRAALNAKDTAKVADINKQLVEKYPNTMAGKRAKAAIFEAENLVVGKIAPDFEAEDVDGKKFKLSDYRGKVVVMEFWGFW